MSLAVKQEYSERIRGSHQLEQASSAFYTERLKTKRQARLQKLMGEKGWCQLRRHETKRGHLLLCSLFGVTHRVHTEWRLPISGVHPITMENKFWLVRVGGASPPPFSLLPSRKKLQCTLMLIWQIQSLCFISILFVLCGVTY
jgi:hypothetical protein